MDQQSRQDYEALRKKLLDKNTPQEEKMILLKNPNNIKLLNEGMKEDTAAQKAAHDRAEAAKRAAEEAKRAEDAAKRAEDAAKQRLEDAFRKLERTDKEIHDLIKKPSSYNDRNDLKSLDFAENLSFKIFGLRQNTVRGLA